MSITLFLKKYRMSKIKKVIKSIIANRKRYIKQIFCFKHDKVAYNSMGMRGGYYNNQGRPILPVDFNNIEIRCTKCGKHFFTCDWDELFTNLKATDTLNKQ